MRIRKSTIIILLAMVVVIGYMWTVVPLEILETGTISTVSESRSDACARMSMQRLTCYGADRHWAFYSHGNEAPYWSKAKVYASSPDGQNWDVVDQFIHDERGGADFSIFQYGNDVHVVWSYGNSPGYPVTNVDYRKGLLGEDGYITWYEPWQTVSSDPYITSNDYDPTICVDANGYPWIGTFGYWDNDGEPYDRSRIWHSDRADGIWEDAPGFEGGFNFAPGTNNYCPMPVPLPDGSVYVLYFINQGYMYTQEGPTYGRLWDANTQSWGPEETITNRQMTNNYFGAISAVSVGYEVHVAFYEEYNGFPEGSDYRFVHCYRDTDGVWHDDDIILEMNYATNLSFSPVLTQGGDGFLLFWAGTDGTQTVDNTFYYKEYTNETHTWSATQEWFTDPDYYFDDRFDYSTLNTYFGEHNNTIGLMYRTVDPNGEYGSDWLIKYNWLEHPTPPDDPDPPYDTDGDGIPDNQDNCPDTWNPDQDDWDGDGIGDACDPDVPPDCTGDVYDCIDGDLYQCQGGVWVLVEENSALCTEPDPPDCTDGEQNCVDGDLYECQGGSWVLIETGSSSCQQPECNGSEQTCIDGDLYECQSGQWVLIEANSTTCQTPPPQCNGSETTCIDGDLYQCQNGQWVLIEEDSSFCQFNECSGSETTCVDGDLYQCQDGQWVMIEEDAGVCEGDGPLDFIIEFFSSLTIEHILLIVLTIMLIISILWKRG